jgi:DNA repair protein RadC
LPFERVLRLCLEISSIDSVPGLIPAHPAWSLSISSSPVPLVSAKRYQRYRSVVARLIERTEFALTEIHQACPSESRGFVTRLVNELVGTGWIVREDDRSIAYFRWNKSRGQFSPEQWLESKCHGPQIKAAPAGDRPRERLMSEGPEPLRLAELLAILIRSGRPGESAVMAGEKLAKFYQGRLHELPAANQAELKEISAAVQTTAWCQIMAGIELGRRIAALDRREPNTRIESTSDALAYCRGRFQRLASDARKEEFHIVTLDTKNRVITTHEISVGTLDASLVHPREVFLPAIKDSAKAVILVHNHPSGDPTPSKEDFAVTRRLESAGDLLGIKILDHIIVGRCASASIRECSREA